MSERKQNPKAERVQIEIAERSLDRPLYEDESLEGKFLLGEFVTRDEMRAFAEKIGMELKELMDSDRDERRSTDKDLKSILVADFLNYTLIGEWSNKINFSYNRSVHNDPLHRDNVEEPMYERPNKHFNSI